MVSTPKQRSLEPILKRLRELADPQVAAGQARFGIRPANGLGIRITDLRALSKGVRDHALAEQLWQTGIHEARILAAYVDLPGEVTRSQMDRWVLDFDSWDVCDQVCSNLFDRTPFVVDCAVEWAERPEEYVRRAGFVLMAQMAVHRTDLPDAVFLPFFPLMVKHALDERNFVKKAVNWALREIGKRRLNLRETCIETAQQMMTLNTPAARWIARDALREIQAKAAEKPRVKK